MHVPLVVGLGDRCHVTSLESTSMECVSHIALKGLSITYSHNNMRLKMDTDNVFFLEAPI